MYSTTRTLYTTFCCPSFGLDGKVALCTAHHIFPFFPQSVPYAITRRDTATISVSYTTAYGPTDVNTSACVGDIVGSAYTTDASNA